MENNFWQINKSLAQLDDFINQKQIGNELLVSQLNCLIESLKSNKAVFLNDNSFETFKNLHFDISKDGYISVLFTEKTLDK